MMGRCSALLMWRLKDFVLMSFNIIIFLKIQNTFFNFKIINYVCTNIGLAKLYCISFCYRHYSGSCVLCILLFSEIVTLLFAALYF